MVLELGKILQSCEKRVDALGEKTFGTKLKETDTKLKETDTKLKDAETKLRDLCTKDEAKATTITRLEEALRVAKQEAKQHQDLSERRRAMVLELGKDSPELREKRMDALGKDFLARPRLRAPI